MPTPVSLTTSLYISTAFYIYTQDRYIHKQSFKFTYHGSFCFGTRSSSQTSFLLYIYIVFIYLYVCCCWWLVNCFLLFSVLLLFNPETLRNELMRLLLLLFTVHLELLVLLIHGKKFKYHSYCASVCRKSYFWKSRH